LLVVEGGVAELAGVATLPAFRRRGLAADISAKMLERHFTAGGKLAWLSAAEAGLGCYRSIGFKEIGSQVNYIHGS
jgi:ribosomal protein S18 acetylase RimI-like enzyme